MDQNVARPQSSQMAMGMALIVVGIIFLGQRLEWGPFWSVSRLGPLILIGIGVVDLLLSGGRSRHGYGWIFLGVIVLLDRRGVLLLGDSWPLFIVAAGVALLVGRRRPSPPRGGGDAH